MPSFLSYLYFVTADLKLNTKFSITKESGSFFKLGSHKSVERDTEEFRKERIESWPNVTVLVHNNPETQVISISRNQRAFSSGSSVAKLFERTLTPALKAYGLTIQIREQFPESVSPCFHPTLFI